MSKLKVSGNASGTGVITLEAPNTNTDRTLTLADADATIGHTVSASDPVITTNPSAVGHLWLNSTSGESYVCTTATSNNNVWKNIGGGTGDIQPYSFDPTSPFEYGDGTDGSVSSITVVDTYLTSSSVSAGANTCTVNSATGFASGDQVLIIQVQKATFTTGVYEMLAISGIVGSTITFASNFQNAYTSNSTAVTTQMIRVPNYSAVTLGSTFNVPAWDGNEGGICIIKCSGTMTLTAQINATGKGFRGGVSTSVGYANPSARGEGQTAESSVGSAANAAGGGGGRMNQPSALSAKTGAGGGHATAGTNGNSNAVGGTAWGGQDLTSHLGFGGGGGAGGYDYSSQGGNGGIGGGIIMIMAETLTLSGSGELAASGTSGTGNAQNNQGGGAGGSIYVKSDTFTSNDNCNAAVGSGGSSGGGAGSVGRIHVQGTLSGTTSPTAYTG
jgi:large repetitive protein